MALLSVVELTVEHPGGRARGGGEAPVRAVDRISFELGAGRTLGLLGESGCGKTTTALAVTGLLRPPARVAGRVRFEGQELTALDPRSLGRLRGDRLAIVFQEAGSALHPVMTIGEQVGEPLRIHRGLSRRAAGAAAIEELRLSGIADPERCAASHPHQLSGGMQKRALLAMALACRPALLVADEPTAGLDVTVQAAVLALLEQRRDETGMALLLLTHDLAVAAERCDEVAVMYAGQIVERAPVAGGELFSAPAHPYTAALLGAMPSLADPGTPPRAIPGHGGPVVSPRSAGGCRFADRCPRVAERCRQVEPELEPAGAGRSVRCHFPLAGEDR